MYTTLILGSSTYRFQAIFEYFSGLKFSEFQLIVIKKVILIFANVQSCQDSIRKMHTQKYEWISEISLKNDTSGIPKKYAGRRDSLIGDFPNKDSLKQKNRTHY